MPTLDLTPFGFTATESLVYRVLLTGGPGTGYAVARGAGLARANAYAALEALVQKGAARADGGRPRRYRAEPAATLLAQIASQHGAAFDQLTRDLAGAAAPDTPTVVEVSSPRGVLQLVSHDVARATSSVRLVAPADAFPLLAPVLRRAASQDVPLALASTGEATLDFADIARIDAADQWPGEPFLAVLDNRTALVASRRGSDVTGHWSAAPAIVAAATLAFRHLTGLE
ncbi:MAG TPA: helix-turn-helix domain-containing protein [Gemmatimonadales bacterium]|nr:helix-turn-helix domain-containing protein [Gemmatimonadales bacterium]